MACRAKKTKWYIKYLLIIAGLLMAILLCVVACRGKNKDLPDNVPASSQYDTQNNIPEDIPENAYLSGTLTISQCYEYYYLEAAIDKFKNIYPDVEIVLNKYDDDTEKYQQQITTQLLAGQADDLLDATAFSAIDLATSGLLADFYPLMKNDPDFIEDDYYMNVFAGMAFNNKLIIFPTCFSYLMIGVNNMFSAELTEKFLQYDKISYWEILEIYNSIEDKGNRYISQDIDALSATYDNFTAFVDIENKKCSFNTPKYIKFINDLKNGTSPQKISNREIGYTYSFSYLSRADQEAYALQYFFANADSNNLNVFLPNAKEEILAHFIPLICEDEKAILLPQKRFCINEASNNKELAWEFVKFITTPEANEGVFIPTFPVNRALFKTYITAELTDFIEYFRQQFMQVDGETTDVVEQVTATLEAYNEMPMKYQLYIEFEAIPEILRYFYANALTAEQAASELQNKMMLYLME